MKSNDIFNLFQTGQIGNQPAWSAGGLSPWSGVLAAQNLQDALLSKSPVATPTTLRFNFSRDQSFSFKTQHIHTRHRGITSWMGRMPGHPENFALLCVAGHPSHPVLTGTLQVDGNTHIVCSGEAGQVHIASGRLDAGAWCKTPSLAASPPETVYDDDTYNLTVDQGKQQKLAEIHLLFCYDQALIGRPARLLGGSGTDTIDPARMMTHLAAFVELTNVVFKNSEIKAAFTLVDAMPMHGEDIRLASVLGKSDENGHYPRELTRMGRQIQVALEEKNADVAVLYGDDGTGGQAGTIPNPPYAGRDVPLSHRVLYLTFGPPGLTLAHELGHLLGARHDRITAGDRADPYSYVRGYVSEDRQLVTVMGYTMTLLPGGQQVPYFSEAARKYNLRPLGIARSEDSRRAADAAPFLRMSVQIMALYKAKPVDNDFTLDVKVLPEQAGYVDLSSLGPYTKGSQISCKAISRSPDYPFKHWELRRKKAAEDAWHEENLGPRAEEPELALVFDAITLSRYELTAHFADDSATYLISTTVKSNTGEAVPEDVAELAIKELRPDDTASLEDVLARPNQSPSQRYTFGQYAVLVCWTGKNLGFNTLPKEWAFIKFMLNGEFFSYKRFSHKVITIEKENNYSLILGKREFRIRAYTIPSDAGNVELLSMSSIEYNDPDIMKYGSAKGQFIPMLIANDNNLGEAQFLTVNDTKIELQEYKPSASQVASFNVEGDSWIVAHYNGWESCVRIPIKGLTRDNAVSISSQRKSFVDTYLDTPFLFFEKGKTVALWGEDLNGVQLNGQDLSRAPTGEFSFKVEEGAALEVFLKIPG